MIAWVHRYLSPTESLAEILFGLVMFLTFTLGPRVALAPVDLDELALVGAAIGCNIAWGLIDAAFYLLGGRFDRRHRQQALGRLTRIADDRAALDLIRENLDPDLAAMAPPAEREALYAAILRFSRRSAPVPSALSRGDLCAAFIVFLLVAWPSLPAALPFLFIADTDLALRVSNLLLIALLFLVGFRWAAFTGAHRWAAGGFVVLLGIVLVLLAIALGG
jgi:hypothetical protein